MCGKSGAVFIKDPFQEDVYNEIVYRWLCGDCEGELWADI
jgi:hypothetical protein